MKELSFTIDQFGSLFPYFIATDENGIVESFGNYIPHLCSLVADAHFSDFFDIIRRSDRNEQTSDDALPLNEMVIIHYRNSPVIYFKGKFEKLVNINKIIFFGSPCYITGTEEIEHQFSLFKDNYEQKLFDYNSGVNQRIVHFDDLSGVIRFFENKENSRTLNDITNDDEQFAITISDSDGKIEWCNSNFKVLTGKSLAEVLGKRPRDIIYGKRSVLIDSNFVDINVQKGKPFYFENIGYKKSGKEFWFGVTVYPVFNKSGGIIGRIHFIKDISFTKYQEQELQEKEILLNLSLETSGLGAWSYDTITGDFQESQLFRQIAGFPETVKISIEDIRRLLSDKELSDFPEDIIKETKITSPSFDREYRIKSGRKYRYFNVVGNCVNWSAQDRPAKLVGMLKDITESKEQSLELERQKKFYEKKCMPH